MVRSFNTRIHTLQHVVIARRMLWLFCLHCGHAARLDPKSLAFKHGALDLEQVRSRARCNRCGQRGRVAVIPDDRQWSGPGG